MLAGFAAFGGALSLYFIVNFPYPFAQWIFAMYAILDFGITLGYLAGWSWGLVLGYAGAIADIFPLALFFFGPLALLTNPGGWLVLLLAGIVVFTFFYLSTKNVKEWFKVEF